VRVCRRFEYRPPVVPVVCGECACVHQAQGCPNCGERPDGVGVGVLQTEVVTEAGARWVVTAERDTETGGWAPVVREPARRGSRTEGQAW
jgi:hypothetical protein